MSLKLKVQSKELSRQFEFDAGEIRIGRSKDAEGSLPIVDVSRQHLLLRYDGETLLAKDLGSSNGTYVEENRLPAGQEIALASGTRLRLGQKDVYLVLEWSSVENTKSLSDIRFDQPSEEPAEPEGPPEVDQSVDDHLSQLYGKIKSEKTDPESFFSEVRQKIEEQSVILSADFSEVRKEQDRLWEESFEKLKKDMDEEDQKRHTQFGQELDSFEKVTGRLISEANSMVKDAMDQFEAERTKSKVVDEALGHTFVGKIKEHQEQLLQNFAEHAERLMDQAREQAEEFKHKATRESERQLQDAKKIYVKAQSDANHQIKVIAEGARREAVEIRERAKQRGEKIIEEADDQARDLLSNVRKHIENLKSEMYTKSESLASSTRVQADEVLKSAHEKAITIQANAEREARSLIEDANDYIEKRREKHEKLAQSKFEEAEAFLQTQIEEAKKRSQEMHDHVRAQLQRWQDDALQSMEEEKRQVSEQILEKQTRLQELAQELTLKETEMANIDERHSKMTEDIKELRSELDSLKRQRNQAEVEVDSLDKALMHSREQLNEAELELQSLQSKVSESREVAAQKSALESQIEQYRELKLRQEKDLFELENQVREDVEKMRLEALSKISDERENTLKNLDAQKKQVEDEIFDLRQQAQVELDEAHRQVEEIKTAAQDEAREYLALQREQADEVLSEARLEGERLVNAAKEMALSEAQAEADSERAKSLQEMAQYRRKEMQEIEVLKSEWEAKQKEQQRQVVETLHQGIDFWLIEKGRQWIPDESERTELLIEAKDELKELVFSLVSGERSEEGFAHAVAEQFAPSTAINARHRKWWMKNGVMAASFVFMILSLAIFPTWPQKLAGFLGRKVSVEKSAMEIHIEEAKQAKEASYFRPDKDEKVRDNYTENVIFNKDFVGVHKSEKYQDYWIVNLNKFLLDELKLKDQSIVELTTLETALVKELEELAQGLKKDRKDKQIDFMRTREVRFMKKAKQVLGTSKNYQKFVKFKRKSLQDYLKDRAVAGE